MPLALLLATWPLAAWAETGWGGWGGSTDTERGYYIDSGGAVLVYNKEVDDDFDPDEIYSGSDLYVPIFVDAPRASSGSSRQQDAIATDKQIKEDEVTVSSKALRGSGYVGEITIVDSKKLKLAGIPAGSYIHVPFSGYEGLNSVTVEVQLVLAVHGTSYQDTRTTFECKLMNRSEEIDSNSVYGAKKPTLLKVARNYRGDATFDFGSKVKFTVRVRPSQKIFLSLSRELDEAIAAMYPNAYLEFFDFQGESDSFDEVGELEIPIDRQKFTPKNGPTAVYAYKINDDTLEAIDTDILFYNQKNSILTMLTRSLDRYVFANQPLMKTVNNPGSDILRSGYAQTPDGKLADTENAAEPGTSQVTAQQSQQTQTQETQRQSGNPPTGGGPINAANASADNPSTGGRGGDSVILAVAAAALSLYWLIFTKDKRKVS